MSKSKRIKRVKMPAVKTKRLVIQAMSRDEMAAKAAGTDGESAMYARHLARAEEQSGGSEKKTEWAFCTHWKIMLKGDSPELAGDLYFKGKPENGSVTIGYRILEKFRKQGYGAEAVAAMIEWAESQEGVFFVDADVEPENEASVKLLEKCGFTKTGTDAENGRLLFEHKKKLVSYMGIYMLLGMSCGMSLGTARGNSATGMSMGLAIGVAIGAGLDASAKKQMKEVEEKRAAMRGYS